MEANLVYTIAAFCISLVFLGLAFAIGSKMKAVKSLFLTVGAVSMAAAVFMGVLYFGVPGESNFIEPDGDGGNWDISMAPYTGYADTIRKTGAAYDFKQTLNFNDTSDAFNAVSQFAQIQIDIENSGDWSQLVFEIDTVGFVDVSGGGSGSTYSILEYSNPEYSANWTHGSRTSNWDIAAPSDANTLSATVVLNLTARAGTVAIMSQYEDVTTTWTLTDSTTGQVEATGSLQWTKQDVTT